MEKKTIEEAVRQFINAANEFDVETALQLFAENAIIDDESVGDKFQNATGVRKYLETFFVGYKTVTKLESLEVINPNYAKAKVDFKGNFGHETGGLNITLNQDGLIEVIDAYLD
jgi:ketosteroid isomerase-like protein